MEEKKTGEGKGGKYLEKDNIFFCGGEEKRRRKIFGCGVGKERRRGNIWSGEEKKIRKEMKEMFWRRKSDCRQLYRRTIEGSIRGPKN